MKSLWSAALSGAILAVAACGDGIVDPVVTFVSVNPDSVTIAVSETVTLAATAQDASGNAVTGQTTVWISNDPDVATVTTAGVVTAVGPGVALVQATVRGIRGTARVSVTPGPAAALTVAPATGVVDSGANRTFEADVEDAFGNDVADPVAWTSTNPAVATVDPVTGRATGVGPGTTFIKATAAGISDSARLDVMSLAFSVIAAGNAHTCAVSMGLATYCWGNNAFGMLGDGTTGGSAMTPLRVPGETEFAAVSAGLSHTCALTVGGAAVCWGRNNRGQLGDNTTTTRPSPTFAVGNLLFRALDVGDQHSCALTQGGSGYCWGDNQSGQLANPIQDANQGPPPPNPSPLAMQASPAFATIGVGASHGCGHTSSGLGQCWGDGTGGALGDDTTLVRAAPVSVSGGLILTAIAGGNDFSCGISGGSAYCWGNNDAGQLGTGDSVATDVPVLVNTGLVFTSIVAGDAHACALTAVGDAYCWGEGASGQLGDGLFASGATPAAVTGGTTFQALAAGGSHTCGIALTGESYCWGANALGQLGDNTTGDKGAPTRIAGQ